MFTMLPESDGNVIGVRAQGRLTAEDYNEFLPQLEAIIATHGPINLLVDMEEFGGWELRAAWDDFTFGITHWNDFGRVALVGNKAWEEMAVKMFNPIMKGEMRLFNPADIDAAWKWVKGGVREAEM